LIKAKAKASEPRFADPSGLRLYQSGVYPVAVALSSGRLSNFVPFTSWETILMN